MAEHPCKQEATLAKIQANLNFQEEQDKKIESNLEKLVTAVQSNQVYNQEHFEKLSNSFVKIETILNEQSKAMANTSAEQANIRASFTNLNEKINNIEVNVNAIGSEVEQVKNTTNEHSDRINKIEKWVIKIVAFAAGLITLIQCAGNFDSIKNLFTSDNPFPSVTTEAVPSTESSK